MYVVKESLELAINLKLAEMIFLVTGYPLYKRRSIGSGGHSFVERINRTDNTIINSWVVQYNPYLCLKYNAHMLNVQIL